MSQDNGDNREPERDAALVAVENAVRRYLKAGGNKEQLASFVVQVIDINCLRLRVSEARSQETPAKR
jgi:hypothetical protein